MLGVNLYLLETTQQQSNLLMSEYLGFIFKRLSQEFNLAMRCRALCLAFVGLQAMVLGLAAPALAQTPANPSSLQSFTKPSQGLVKELESGLSRIQKNCGIVRAPAFKDGYPTDELLAKIRASNAISESEMAKVSTKVSTSLQLLSEQTPSRCKVPGVSMFDSSCKANESQVSRIKNIEADAQVLYKETVDRYKLYVQSIQLENSNCARAGFSSKLWQTEEQYVQPSLLRFSGFFIQQVDDFLSKP
jgi:hypothetical protein